MIRLKMAKEYTKDWKPKLTEQFFENFEKTKAGKIPYRVYIPFTKSSADTDKYGKRQLCRGWGFRETTFQDLKAYLKKQKYYIWNYDFGIAKQYAVGNKASRFIKIGKLLKKNKELKKFFDNDPRRDMVKKTRTEKQIIVISRHPVDIVGASTGRRWSSCIRVTYLDQRDTIYYEVKGGALVAYIIGENDKNIKHPSARIMLRPWTSLIKGKKNFLAQGDVYGTCQRGPFTAAVKKFLAEINPTSGIFKRFEGSYRDGGPTNQGVTCNFIETETFHIQDKIKNFKDFADSVEWFSKIKFSRSTTQTKFNKHKVAFEILKTYRQMIGVPRMKLKCRMTKSQYCENFWKIENTIILKSTQEDINDFFNVLKELVRSLKSGKGNGSGATDSHIKNLKIDLKKVMKDIQEQKNLELAEAA